MRATTEIKENILSIIISGQSFDGLNSSLLLICTHIVLLNEHIPNINIDMYVHIQILFP